MALPAVNPIDSEWFPKGSAIDHLGTVRIQCRACGQPRQAERYKILVTRGIGFGAPFFVAPFLKRRSTAGKTGKKVVLDQCTTCESMWPVDEVDADLLEQVGLPRVGIPNPALVYEMFDREAAAAESAAPAPKSSSRVRKLPSQQLTSER